VAVITAHGNVESAVRALKLGAFDFVSKPLDSGRAAQIGRNCDQARCARHAGPGRARSRGGDRRLGAYPGPRLMGHSARDERRCVELIARVARSQAPGPYHGGVRHRQGTGRAPDPRQRRQGRLAPFVPVNCGAIPFRAHGKRAIRPQTRQLHRRRGGQERPGAKRRRAARLFLDEVADLPLHMQVKLLRVIQEKTVRPDR
jgi:two-component system response regulator PilR (NtrC family)